MTEGTTGLDLDAIEARAKAAGRSGLAYAEFHHHAGADVTALVAEVRRLRDELSAAKIARITLTAELFQANRARDAALEEARLWRALAKARSHRGIPMIEGVGEELARREQAGSEAIDGLRALGIAP